MNALLLTETLHQLKLFSRRPPAVFFVVFMPVVLLLLFTSIFGNEEIPGLGITTAQFYTPGLAVFGAVMACYTYLSISTSAARDLGILKRLRGTPLPPWVYIMARIAAVSVIGIVTAVLVMLVGGMLYSVVLLPDKILAASLSLIVGCLAFSAMGMALTGLCKNSETVQAVSNATLLPMAFISDVFVRPSAKHPEWISTLGNVFPLKHFVLAFADGFKPLLDGSGFAFYGDETTYAIGWHLAVLAAWGLAGAVVAIKLFRWEPEGRS
ncbi:MAG: ABC transporter permease [Hyphomicrobiales bacterium]